MAEASVARLALAKRASAEMIERKSLFIGTAAPVASEAEARELIEEMRHKYHDATHNVYAYSIREGSVKRFSDDGEPQGTAGMPVLNVITQEGITDCVVVVTRYFGGILLGGGGLVRAYSHSAKLGVDAAQIITMAPWFVCTTSCDYTYYGKIETLIRDFGGVMGETDFGENVNITFRIEKGTEGEFDKKLKDLTNAKVSFEILEEIVSAK